jgi:hypothetical protein
MATRFRKTPTTDGSKAIRDALASQGIKARVATQRYAYRVVSDDARALSALTTLGLEGPTGGEAVRSGPNCFFAYEFAA